MTTKHTGDVGEELACQALSRRGYNIVERNWRWSGDGLRGEIDIVARDGACWAFVEVKTRRGRGVEPAEEALTRRQARHLTRLAQQYLAAHDLYGVDWRLDLAAVELDAGGRVRRFHLAQALVAD